MRLLARGVAPALAAMVATAFAPLVTPMLAQSQASGGSQPDLVAVVLWTLTAAIVAMLVLTLGYLYRRMRGAQDEVIPQNVDPYFQAAGHVEAHSTGELHPELPPVPEHQDPAAGQVHGSSH